MNDKNQGGITEIVSIGSANFEILKRFFLERGFGSIDENGNFSTNPMSIEEFSEINEKLAEFLDRNESNTLPDNGGEQVKPLDLIPLIKATTHRVKSLPVDVSKAGRKLREKRNLPYFYECEGVELTTKKSSKNKKQEAKPVKTFITLAFQEGADEWKHYIPENKQIQRVDIIRGMHASALFTAGNTVISSDMLIRQMSGGKILQATPAQRKEIQDSFARLGQTWITINAEQEFKAGYNTQAMFKGNLLPCSMLVGDVVLNGQPAHDCIRIYDASPLIRYAIIKGQVSPISIEMLNIPGLNMTDESIELLDYLTRAYASMINPHSPVKPIISYDTLYEYLGVDESKKQVRIIKARIREAVRKILTAWVEGKFIKGFRELTANNKAVKERVKAAKVILDLYTKKEFDEIHKNELNP